MNCFSPSYLHSICKCLIGRRQGAYLLEGCFCVWGEWSMFSLLLVFLLLQVSQPTHCRRKQIFQVPQQWFFTYLCRSEEQPFAYWGNKGMHSGVLLEWWFNLPAFSHPSFLWWVSFAPFPVDLSICSLFSMCCTIKWELLRMKLEFHFSHTQVWQRQKCIKIHK